MKNKKLLVIILLSLSFCFVSGAVYGEAEQSEILPDSEMTEQEKKETQPSVIGDLSGVFEQWSGGDDERFTFLVIPVNAFVYTQDGEMVMNWSLQYVMAGFQGMYPDAEIPSEFSGIGETESTVNPNILQSMLSSMALTMAYQQGYYLYAVAKDYIILVKKIEEKSEEVE